MPVAQYFRMMYMYDLKGRQYSSALTVQVILMHTHNTQI